MICAVYFRLRNEEMIFKPKVRTSACTSEKTICISETFIAERNFCPYMINHRWNVYQDVQGDLKIKHPGDEVAKFLPYSEEDPLKL